MEEEDEAVLRARVVTGPLVAEEEEEEEEEESARVVVEDVSSWSLLRLF